MTVAELISKLQNYNPDMLVVIDGDVNDDWVETELSIDEGMFGREHKNYGWFFHPREDEELEPHHFPCILLRSPFA